MNRFLFTILCATLLPASMMAEKKTEINDTVRVYDIEEVYVYDQPTVCVSNH